jgi:hypothetical protein
MAHYRAKLPGAFSGVAARGTKQRRGRLQPETSRLEDIMNKIAISFVVGASALFATAATAAPLMADQSVSADSNIQNVRLVCREDGRCWRQRDDRRVIIRDSYGYDAPRERYIERRGYDERGGIGFSAPGVSVGIGR